MKFMMKRLRTFLQTDLWNTSTSFKKRAKLKETKALLLMRTGSRSGHHQSLLTLNLMLMLILKTQCLNQIDQILSLNQLQKPFLLMSQHLKKKEKTKNQIDLGTSQSSMNITSLSIDEKLLLFPNQNKKPKTHKRNQLILSLISI